MKKLLKPASLLFNFLCLFVFFLAGMHFAGWIDAGKDQGLAGGAIVLGWGVLFAILAFVGSFFLTYHVIHKRIVTGNWLLLALLALGYGTMHYRFMRRDKLQEEKNSPYKKAPTTPTETPEQRVMIVFK